VGDRACPVARFPDGKTGRNRLENRTSLAYVLAMTARRASAIVLGCTLAVTAAAGCGSSAPSRQAFRKQANAICVKYTRKADAVPIPTFHVARYYSRLLGVLEESNGALVSVAPPLQDRDRFQDYLAVRAKVLRDQRKAQRVMAIYEPHMYAALRDSKPAVHIPDTPEGIAHPTAATIKEVNSIPGFRKAFAQMSAQMDAATRSAEADGKRQQRLAEELGLNACD
jgi:hypothetical protein